MKSQGRRKTGDSQDWLSPGFPGFAKSSQRSNGSPSVRSGVKVRPASPPRTKAKSPTDHGITDPLCSKLDRMRSVSVQSCERGSNVQIEQDQRQEARLSDANKEVAVPRMAQSARHAISQQNRRPA